MPRRSQSSDPIDLDEEDECKSKRSRASIRRAPKMPGSSNRIASSRRDKENQDKLDTRIFDLYMEDLWKRTDEDQKNAYAYLDPLWFNSYVNGGNEQKSRILRWTKKLKIFSRKYVFVPIVLWGHWNLLVLCHFDETDCSDAKKGPRMLLLDSLNTTDPKRLGPDIRGFIRGIYEIEERKESAHFIEKIRLEFPKVPQQNGEECGIYVLYFINCFLQNGKLAEVLQNKTLEEDFKQLFDDGTFDPEELENFRKDVHAFQVERSTETGQ
ncbi:Ubiquitin-like-specific protease 2 [Hordeum vulgare]|uniref:Ubiquitin-like protease family profile domain-containing protein n=1 Tax=Hordeum vulgare subsp. vulgare TaxID=112509 RepID=A0A8I6WZ41_HORVV|nr:probable ubiquitin-like-specific protease 2A isoform X1 [Hordeum vulgare subsp. vulgare]KAE8776082.1 Ubiquitin-like-specific protease 2 [Hordeum vulgare]KAI4997686.1 hypothetical protein ZWY2020_053028 [Hordeum vulgare]